MKKMKSHSGLWLALGLMIASPVAGLAQEVAATDADQPVEAGPEVNAEESNRDGRSGAVLPDLLAAIAAERAALQRRALALDKREAELAFAAASLSEQDQQLTALKDEIDRLLNLAEANHTQDVARLVKIYRAMKPVDAAAILSDADLEVSVLVIAAMSERDSGPILAKMSKIRAQAISKIILERSRLPGDQNLVNLKVN